MEEALHALGNGRLLVALKGLDIYDFKPVGGIGLFSAVHDVVSTHRRIGGKAVYRHLLKEGTITEYVTDENCFVREFDLTAPVRMKIALKPQISVCKENCYGVKKGVFFVNDYPTASDAYFSVFGEGLEIRFPEVTLKGKGRLVVKLSETPNPDFETGKIYSPAYPGVVGVERESIYDRAAEDFFFLMESFRSAAGGFIAAVEWNLCYVRDLYGAARGMLAAGWYEPVAELLQFFFAGFLKNGFVATAYTVDGLYTPHRHECDKAENTGYLVLLAAEYLRATGDRKLFGKIMPMLVWCVRAQAEVCFGGMLPFSGDETYLAGGMMSKVHLDDGSAEATMLFIASAKKMAPYMAGDSALGTAGAAAEKFRGNFIRRGRLVANQPARRRIAPLPPRKHGCCVYCLKYCDLTSNEFGLYRCPDCEKLPQRDLRSNTIYELACVSMEPLFFGSDLFCKEELKGQLEALAVRAAESGYIGTEDKTTGYESGLLLYGLSALNSEHAQAAEKTALGMRDEEGVWAEYYVRGKATGMRWRPWETGVNLCALLKRIKQQKNRTLKTDKKFVFLCGE